MSGTIHAIAQQIEKDCLFTNLEVKQIRNAANGVVLLRGCAQEVGKALESIIDISEQFNLSALNSNLDAARAGKAGEGFAVTV